MIVLCCNCVSKSAPVCREGMRIHTSRVDCLVLNLLRLDHVVDLEDHLYDLSGELHNTCTTHFTSVDIFVVVCNYSHLMCCAAFLSRCTHIASTSKCPRLSKESAAHLETPIVMQLLRYLIFDRLIRRLLHQNTSHAKSCFGEVFPK